SSYTCPAGASDTEDSTSPSSLNIGIVFVDKSSGGNGGARDPSFTSAALRRLGIRLEEGEDIDFFIANLTIPPPPEGGVDLQTCAENRKTGERVRHLRVCYPAASSNLGQEGQQVFRRYTEPKKESAGRVGKKDHDIGEVHVGSETTAKRASVAGKVASLQRRFEVPPRTAYGSPPTSSASVDNRRLLPKLSKENSHSPSDSSGYDSPRSNNSNFRQMTSAKNTGGSRESGDSKQPSVTARVRTFSSGGNWTASSLQRQMTVPTGNLSKSASRDDTTSHASYDTIPKSSTKASASSEDVGQAKASPGSPSKQSVASGNDSLALSSTEELLLEFSIKL
ncbi:putative Exocyst complex component 5-like 2, partial [Homarus americanus]